MHDTDTERALLGALLLDDIDVPVDADDFEGHAHQLIFKTITALRADGKPVDPLTVARTAGKTLDDFGGAAQLLDMQQQATGAWMAPQYAAIVAENARRRRIHRAATLAAEYAESGNDLMERQAEAVAEAVMHRHERDASKIGDLLGARYETLDKPRDYVWLTDFPGIHLHFGDFCILAARPGVGKSALALQWGEEWAFRNLKTRIYSLEMSDTDYADRVIMRHTDFTTNDLDKGLDADDIKTVIRQTAPLRAIPLEIIDRPLIGVDGLCRDARRAARKGTRIIVIDYLQLLVNKAKDESRYEAVTETSRKLKLLARETGLLVVALSQLNRGSIGKDGKPRIPTEADLRESGALEQDADDIALIHAYEPEDTATREQLERAGYVLEFTGQREITHVEWVKLRRGRQGRRFCWFDGGNQHFTPIDRAEMPL